MAVDGSVVRFTNCKLAIGHDLVQRDLWLSGTTGRIIEPQQAFFDLNVTPTSTHDLGGRILAPGFIDVQLNGGFGFDFSVPSERYAEDLQRTNRKLIQTGVTSYLPTVISSKSHVYHKTLPHLAAPAPEKRDPLAGAESLGAHCEGPFLNPARNGIHKKSVLQAPRSMSALEACYGASNLVASGTRPPAVRMVTLAAELDDSRSVVPTLASRNIIPSIGHSAATYEQANAAISQGASMITHLFNAMNQPHHRETGIFGVLGAQEGLQRPYFGLIADGIHVHPSMVKVAYSAHPDGCILVTDAMSVLGLDDGEYPLAEGETVIKKGGKVTLKGTDGTIAGSCVTIATALENLVNYASVPLATALRTVTSTPAALLGLSATKGTLAPGADADLVVLTEKRDAQGRATVVVDEVWKFGVRVYEGGEGERRRGEGGRMEKAKL